MKTPTTKLIQNLIEGCDTDEQIQKRIVDIVETIADMQVGLLLALEKEEPEEIEDMFSVFREIVTNKIIGDEGRNVQVFQAATKAYQANAGD